MDTGRFKRLTRPGAVKRILVRGTNWIGDAVLTTPVLAALRAGFPQAKIALLVKPVVAELLQCHPAIDDIVPYRDPGPHAGLGGKLSLALQLNRGHYDLAVLLQNAFEAAAVTALAGIPNRYGYATDGRSFLLTHRVALTPKTRRKHQVEYYLDLLRPLGIPVEPSAPTLRTTPGEDAAASELLHAFGVKLDQVVIGLNPGSVYGSAKRWIPERFAQVADRLAAEHEACVLIFGGRGEEELGTAIAGMMTAPTIVYSGRTTVRQLMALIKQCKLFITNDTGPMHVAAAFGVPLVAIFGPTNPVTTAPYGPGHELVRHPVECSPCLLRECPIDHRCMQGIGVDTVYAAAAKQLAGLSRASQTSPLHGGVVYLDRDGTLNFDRAGFKTVVLSNQSGLARGLITPEQLDAIHRRLRELLAADGARLDGIFICPHHPEDVCSCRKPSPGLVLRARQELGLAPDHAIVIGDKASDVGLAQNIGATAVFVSSGHHPEEEQARMADQGLAPDFTARDLAGAVKWILEKENVLVLE
ncbi:MAG: lipopolysaccharide heptosyltransferase II [Nitrospirae bacterium]|nr:lipopolysaccharide heptosyltransferase II [Nitrospirota bacterium]